MMENVLETRDQQIYRLEKDIQLAEETTTLKFVCEKCEKNQDFQKDNHNNSIHVDENLPTTSNCGRCGFSSDDENDLVNSFNFNLKAIEM